MLGYDYQRLAMRTARLELSEKELLCDGAMGLCGEAGECCDLIKKHVFQGHMLDADKLIDEMSDVMWYLALICHVLGTDLDLVMEHNIKKLMKRYPNGFEVEKSVNRSTDNDDE